MEKNEQKKVDKLQDNTAVVNEKIKKNIINLLRATGRENMERVISWMRNNGFFSAPATKTKYHNVRGGLARHSWEVYQVAMKLNETEQLPVRSVTLCALLHDICKGDQYIVDEEDKPQRVDKNLRKGHGRRSVELIRKRCMMPLNLDEELAIWFHLGANEKSLESKEADAPYIKSCFEQAKKSKLCKLIQKANLMATGRWDKTND